MAEAVVTAPAHERNHRALAYGIAAAIFILDQASKWMVINIFQLRQRQVVDLLPFFDLRWVENRGVSLGLLSAGTDMGRWLLVAMTAAIALGVAIWIWRERAKGDAIALSMVLGGALGNIVDRTRFGYVVDFLDLHIGEWRPFLVFNVADAAITIGVLLLLVRAFLPRGEQPSRKEK